MSSDAATVVNSFWLIDARLLKLLPMPSLSHAETWDKPCAKATGERIDAPTFAPWVESSVLTP